MANAAKRMPDVKKMMDKRLVLQLNGHRCIEGTLRGYDQFINLTLADVVDKTVTGTSAASNRDLGMVVRSLFPTQDWTRGLWCRVCALVNHADVVFLTLPVLRYHSPAAFFPPWP